MMKKVNNLENKVRVLNARVGRQNNEIVSLGWLSAFYVYNGPAKYTCITENEWITTE